MKTYEIEGLKIISNIYPELLWRRVNQRLDQLSPFVLWGLVCWAVYIYLLVREVPGLVVINYLR